MRLVLSASGQFPKENDAEPGAVELVDQLNLPNRSL
jgi:hypothetical protein